MRIVLSDPEAQPSYVIVQLDKPNNFGGANTNVLQVLMVKHRKPKKSFFYIGRLRFETQLQCWIVDEAISNEIWLSREEAENALITGKYTKVDYSDGD